MKTSIGQFITLGVLGAALAPAPVLAQQAQPPVSPATAQSEEQGAPTSELGEVIVTAQRRSERLRDVPVSISAQTSEDLDRAGITSVKELAARVPGVTFGTTGAWALPSIRGVNTGVTGIASESPIAIYVDGVYRSNPVGNIFDLPDTSRVEVLKGPQGTLFGRNATGGAISVYTLDPTFDLTGKYGVSAGVYSGNGSRTAVQTTAKGFISIPLVQDLLAASFSGYYQDTGGYLHSAVTGNTVGDGHNQMYRGKLLYTPNENVRLLFSGFYGELEDVNNAALAAINRRSVSGTNTLAGTPRFAGPVVIPNGPYEIADEYDFGGFTKSEEYSFGLRGEFTIPSLGTITSITSYAKVSPEVLSNTDASYAPACLAINVCNEFYATQETKSTQQELVFASNPFGDFGVVAGLFYFNDDGRAIRNVNAPGVPSPSADLGAPGVFYDNFSASTRAYAAFGELSWQATERLKVIAGVRYSKEERELSRVAIRGFTTSLPFVSGQADFDAWTPRVSVRYDVNERANVYATYSKGFKSGLLPTANPAGALVAPEQIEAIEVGTKIGTPDFNLNAAVFFQQYDDLQAQFFTGATTVAQSASAEISGAEVDGQARFGNFELRAAVSYLPKADYTEFPAASYFALLPATGAAVETSINAAGFRLLKTPEWTGSVTGTYGWDMPGDRRLELSGTVYHSSDFNWDIVGRVHTDGYTTVSGQLALIPAGDGIRISIWGKNLTNETFLTGTIISAAGDGGIFGAPRQIGISLDRSF